jgi:hypothetical protein
MGLWIGSKSRSKSRASFDRKAVQNRDRRRKTVKDAVGNELRVGDLVALSLDRPLIYGRIVELVEGGIVTGIRGGQAEVRPGRVTVASNHTIDNDPRNAVIGALLSLRDPNPPSPAVIEAAEKAASSDKPN